MTISRSWFATEKYEENRAIESRTGIVAVQKQSSGILLLVVLAGLFVTMTVTSGLGFTLKAYSSTLVVEGFSVSIAGAGTGIFFAVSGTGYYAGFFRNSTSIGDDSWL